MKHKCVVCNTHNVARKGGLTCHSPRCKRQYLEQRATTDGKKFDAMAQAEQHRQTRESTKRIKQMRKRVESPRQEAQRIGDRVQSLIDRGMHESSAVAKVAQDNRATNAQVLYAWRSTTTSP
jgi:uncharacterized protein with GYD domain